MLLPTPDGADHFPGSQDKRLGGGLPYHSKSIAPPFYGGPFQLERDGFLRCAWAQDHWTMWEQNSRMELELQPISGREVGYGGAHADGCLAE